MSHTCFHYPHAFELVPLTTSPRATEANLFNIKTLQKEGGDWQHVLPVYVPPEVQEHYRAGVLKGFHITALAINSLPMRLLPGQPAYAMLGAELSDGRRINTVPSQFDKARRARVGAAAVLLFAGGVVGSLIPWAGVLLATLSTHPLRTALSMPRKPF